MVEKIRKSEEEKVIEMLKREGFRELSKKEIQKEPNKSIYDSVDLLHPIFNPPNIT